MSSDELMFTGYAWRKTDAVDMQLMFYFYKILCSHLWDIIKCYYNDVWYIFKSIHTVGGQKSQKSHWISGTGNKQHWNWCQSFHSNYGWNKICIVEEIWQVISDYNHLHLITPGKYFHTFSSVKAQLNICLCLHFIIFLCSVNSLPSWKKMTINMTYKKIISGISDIISFSWMWLNAIKVILVWSMSS